MRSKFLIIIITVLLFTLISGCADKKNIGWIKDFDYSEDQVTNITFRYSCPNIPVTINSREFTMGFDTGNGAGIFLTTALEGKVDYDIDTNIKGSFYQTNPDGTYRGGSTPIVLKNIKVFGDEFTNVKSSISDWRIFSSSEFNGTVGLKFFQKEIITIDYKNGMFAIKNTPIDYNKLQNEHYTIFPLIKSDADRESSLLFFNEEVDGVMSTIYLDTGASRSFVNTGDNKNTANVKLGDKTYNFSNLMTDKIGFRGSFQYPLRFALNSDILKSQGLVVTIDGIENKLILH